MKKKKKNSREKIQDAFTDLAHILHTDGTRYA